jgi:hypothetical protein
MSTNANIVLTDGEATPVDHTFNPGPTFTEDTTWVNRSGGILIGNEKLRMKVHEASGNEQYSRITVVLSVPTLETISGENNSGLVAQPTLAYIDFAEVNFRMHKRGSKQKRKNLRLMLVDALTTALVVSGIDDLELPY